MNHNHHNARSYYSFAEEEQQHQLLARNGMKRPREELHHHYFHPTAGDPACEQMTKRFKRMGCPSTADSSYSHNSNNHNHSHNHPNDASRGFSSLFHSKSDDEVSLAEESPQTFSSAVPNHSSLPQTMMGTLPKQQPHATDYQPMNALLGNLHALRQQQQQRRRQLGTNSGSSLQGRALHAQHQPQTQTHTQTLTEHQPQTQYYHRNDRHYGNYHSVPSATAASSTGTTSSGAPGENRPRRRNAVSLRVSSNLY